MVKKNGKVAIIPLITDDETNTTFYRQEYLGLYPYLDYTGATIWVNGKTYITLKDWLTQTDPLSKILYS